MRNQNGVTALVEMSDGLMKEARRAMSDVLLADDIERLLQHEPGAAGRLRILRARRARVAREIHTLANEHLPPSQLEHVESNRRVIDAMDLRIMELERDRGGSG